MYGCLEKFQLRLRFDDVEDMIDKEVQEGEGDGVFGLCLYRGSVLLGNWGSVPSCTFSQAMGLRLSGSSCKMAALERILFNLKCRLVGVAGADEPRWKSPLGFPERLTR